MAWAAIGAAAVGVVGSYLTSDHGGGGGGSGESAQIYDPYAPYRGAAAEKLNALMADPTTIQNLPEYQARMQAASRLMASQGYTGSGNALVAAANAGGIAYQDAFANLAQLSGATQNPATGAGMAQQEADYNQQQRNQMWGQIGNLAGNVISHYTSGNNGGGYTTYNAPLQIDYQQPVSQGVQVQDLGTVDPVYIPQGGF